MTHELPKKTNTSRKMLWIGVFILFIGAVLRLAAFDETLILGDQSAILDAAFQAAHLRYFPAVGMKSSAGVMQTGIIPLLAAIPLIFVKRIIAVQWFFSALDLLALAWLFRAVRKTIGGYAACIAALLYATAPWVVLYTRTIWFQTLIATFATMTFASILLLLADNNSGILVLALTCTTMMSMVHLAAAPWGVLLFVAYTIIAYRQRLWKSFLWGVAISCVIVLPYVVFLFQSSFADIAYILKTGTGSAGLNTTAYRLSKELISGAMIIANAHGDLWDRSVIMWDSAGNIVLVILGISFLWACYHIAVRRQLRTQLVITIVWLLAVPALFLRSNIHLQHFYMMMIFPAPFVLIAGWIENCIKAYGRDPASRLWKVTGSIGAVLIILIAVWWSSLWIIRIGFEARGLLERPTRGWLMDKTAEVISRYLREESGSEVIILTEFEGEMSSFDWLRGYVQTDAIRVISSGQGFIIPEGAMCYLLDARVTEQCLEPVATLVTERPDMTIPANPPWHFYCGGAHSEQYTPLASWENGMHLLNTDVTGEFRPGGQIDIVHTWKYNITESGAYHFYNHVLLEETLVVQVDGRGVPFWYWRDGDTLLTYFTLSLPDELPEGDYTLRTGMYTWPGLQRILRQTGDDGYAAFKVTVKSP